MATKQVNYSAERHSETNLSHLQGIEYARNVINTQCGAIFEKCKTIADQYGHEPQSRMLQEEAAELINLKLDRQLERINNLRGGAE